MAQAILVKQYEAPPINRAEIFRYMGDRNPTMEVRELVESCLQEVLDQLTYRVCYQTFPFSLAGDQILFPFGSVVSSDLAKNLAPCCQVSIFGATIGIAIDRQISKYGRISPSRGLVFQAIGAERIESLCDRFQEEIAQMLSSQGMQVRPRFSPGYGNLPLSFQTEIFRVLDCSRKIGLSLNDSLLMSPSKSVTALFGAGPSHDVPAPSGFLEGCRSCTSQHCAFRR